MSIQKDEAKSGGNKAGQTEELKTDSPISEKDEVKAAEERMAKQQKQGDNKLKSKDK